MSALVIRTAQPADQADVVRLSVLDSSPVPSGDLLLAWEGGALRAALSLQTGHAVADPFWPSARLVTLLRTSASPSLAPRRTLRRRLRRLALAAG